MQTAERIQWWASTLRSSTVTISAGNNSFAKALNWDLATAPCWNVPYAGGRRLVTYRTDVLRFLPIDKAGSPAINPNFGKQAVNGLHRVVVPDVGELMATT